MAHRSSRHRTRPIAALALEAGTTIGPRCANVHLGPEDQIPPQTGRIYDRTRSVGNSVSNISLDIREESIYGLLGHRGAMAGELTRLAKEQV
jgi:hypothetical protein